MRAGFSVVAHFAGKREIEVLLIAEGFERYAEAMEAAGPRLTDTAVAYRAFALIDSGALPADDRASATPLAQAVVAQTALVRGCELGASLVIELDFAAPAAPRLGGAAEARLAARAARRGGRTG